MLNMFKQSILPQKILQELAAKQKEVIKAQTEAEKLFQEKGFDPGVQKLAEEMKQLQQKWGDASEVSCSVAFSFLFHILKTEVPGSLLSLRERP